MNDKKQSIKELISLYPVGISKFLGWMAENYQIRDTDYDQAISMHRYIIAARYFGYSLKIPENATNESLEQKITNILDTYEKAYAKNPLGVDPLKALTDTPWEERNRINDQIFKKQTSPALRDALVLSFSGTTRKNLSAALIELTDKQKRPFKTPGENKQEKNSRDHGITEEHNPYAVTAEQEQFWIDNIYFSWKVDAGEITVPF